jgi:hypothetical protein
MKVLVTIRTTQTATIDVGDLPIALIQDLLTKNDGTFDGNWGPSDVAKGTDAWVTDSVDVVESVKAGK